MSKRNGFTLVELLVVIAIIGVLVALLMAGVMAARETARQTTCMNNQQQIGKAIVHYETTKNPSRYPGFLNPRGINWVMILLPYLNREDLWDGGMRMGTIPAQPVRVTTTFCPGDAAASTLPGYGLSYVVNIAMFRDLTTGKPEDYVSSSQVKAPSQTVMLGEKLNVGPWIDPTKKVVMTDPTKLAFMWPDYSKDPQPPATMISPNVLSSNHSGIVIMTFCDGHSDKIREETDCNPLIGNIYGWP